MIASKEFVIKTMVSILANAKKKYSQNFLIDHNIVLSAVNSLSKDVKQVIEIGPGLGALTEEILNQNYLLDAYEIDEVMVDHLTSHFARNNNLKIIKGDFLKQDLSHYQNTKVSFISNIPYSLTTPIIEKVILQALNIDSFIFMLQKEAGQRITSKKGSKDYGPLPIFLTYIGDISPVCKVTRDKFLPSPNVDSVILKLQFNKNRDFVLEKKLYSLLNNCFRMRRKTLLNNLSIYHKSKDELLTILSKCNLKPTCRPEELSLDDYLNLLNLLNQ